MTATCITFLVGKPIERSPVLPQVADLLRDVGVVVKMHVPAADASLPDGLDGADLLVLRGLTNKLLGRLDPWAARCCNHPVASRAVTDRWRLIGMLDAAGIKMPPSQVAETWSEVLAAGGDLVIKAANAATGRGAGVLLPGEPRPAEAGFSGPYLLQESVGMDGFEAKLYVVGEQVRGVRRPTGRRGGGDPYEPAAPEVATALAVGRALGLEVFGVDAMVGSAGSWVVDVNVFPSAAKVPGAAAWIADYLLARASC